jgi:phosphohistidine phosphatase
MRTLSLVRHSIAQEPEEVENDFDRKLTEKGQALAYTMATKIPQEYIQNALFISSSAPRALETAYIFAKYHKIQEKDIIQHEFLYSCFKEHSFFYFLDEIAPKHSNCWVFGHNPMLSNIMAILQNKQTISMPKCAVAIFNTEAQRWIDVNHNNVKLVKFLNPKQI